MKYMVKYYKSVKDGKGKWRNALFSAIASDLTEKRVIIENASILDAPRGCNNGFWERLESGTKKNKASLYDMVEL